MQRGPSLLLKVHAQSKEMKSHNIYESRENIVTEVPSILEYK